MAASWTDEVLDLEIDVFSVGIENRGFGGPGFPTEMIAMSCAATSDRECSDGGF